MRRQPTLRGITGSSVPDRGPAGRMTKSIMRLSNVFAIFVACSLAAAPGVRAQEGGYEPSFGDNGRTWIDVSSGSFDAGRAIRSLADGTLFVAGNCSDGFFAPTHVCATWLDTHGNYAAGYGPGGNGRVRFDAYSGWPGTDSRFIDALILPDGRAAVLCSINGDSAFGLAVLTPDGADLDHSVGTNGFATIFGTDPGARTLYGMTRQSDGHVVAAGYARNAGGNYDMLALRLTPAFALDTSFGSGGYATIDFPIGTTYSDVALAVAAEADGRIVLVGAAENASSANEIAAARLTSTGALDTTFGPSHNGRFESTFGWPTSAATSIALDAQHRILFGGTVINGDTNEWIVGRLTTAGDIDSTFYFGQPQIFPVGASPSPASSGVFNVLLQSDGKILAGGTVPRATDSVDHYFGIARFNDDGTFDGSFGLGGFSYGGLSDRGDNTSDEPYSILLANRGLMIAGYTTITNGEARFTVAELQIDLVFANGFDP